MNNVFLLNLSIGYTLVDVTNTNEVSNRESSIKRNQQRNWETLVQVLGLRAQIILLGEPECVILDVKSTRFGEYFSGKQAIWTFKFGVEQEAVFSNHISSHGTLTSDFENVPIITKLTETANIIVPMFVVEGKHKNIYFDIFKI